MDGFSLRCNNLRCRRILDIRAVVTTCSHVFCETCAESLHLINPPAGRSRQCPACQSSLTAPDDAVITDLNPSEDYRTSLLSGLCPSIIMEICQRGLTFWNYQVTQEVVYQETIAKGLTEKCIALSNDLDKVINDANLEISRLQEKVAELVISEKDLKKKNHELAENWREKGRKLAQTQELYDKLKRRTLMTQVGQGAVENLERAFGNGPQPVLHDLTGLDDGNFPIQQRQQPTVRRHKNAVEPDLIMTGARIGTINGSRRPRQGSGSSSGRNSPRYSNGSQDMFRTGSQQAAFFGQENMMPAPSGSQEHRQRLPPTPIANRGRTTLYGQSTMGMGASANRNPLGTMNGNSHKVGGGFVGGGYAYGK